MSDISSRQELYDLANQIVNLIDRSVNVEGLEDVEAGVGSSSFTLRIRGDWKHDHLRADYLIRNYFADNDAWRLTDIEEDTVEEDGSDWYVADHTYVLKKKANDKALTENKSTAKNARVLTEDNLNPYWRKEAKKQYKQYDKEFSAKKQEIDDLVNILKNSSTTERGAVDKFEQKMKELLPQFKFDDYGKNVEKEQYPYYVTLYDKSAVYEPAEGGYYVEVQYPAYSDGYSTYEDAKADLEDYITSDTENWHKVDEDAYEWTGKYVGDGQYIRIETDKTYLKAVASYNGYESFTHRRMKSLTRPVGLQENKDKASHKPNLNEQIMRQMRKR